MTFLLHDKEAEFDFPCIQLHPLTSFICHQNAGRPFSVIMPRCGSALLLFFDESPDLQPAVP